MRNKLIKGLTWVLILALVLSLVSGLFVMGNAVSVDYQTGSYGKFSNVILNWGQRGTTATYLSPNAEDFYEDNGITYDLLAQLDGGTSSNAYQSELYDALQDLMADNHTTITSYEDTKELYRFTDCQNNQNTALNSISSFYSGIGIGPGWGQGNNWNREHTWPNSKGKEGHDENDIMMLRPTASSENSSRGNKAYGESSGYYNPNDISGGTYNLHGDVARIMLYVYVRWGNHNLWGTNGVLENLDLMLRWMEEDPVDTWEMGRNDSVESITGTRNVFVDYPELAFLLFLEEIPEDMITPSGEAARQASPYTITASTNNAAYGTVSVSGRVINASPAEGYEATGYTVLSGSATVTQNGNSFVVKAESDCQIRILFAPRSACQVQFMEDGRLGSTATAFRGDEITFPVAKNEITEGFTFVGWIHEDLEETTDRPGQIYLPSATYTVSGNTTFYALYSRFDDEGQSGGMFEKHTGALTPGNYLITHDNGALQAAPGSNGRLAYMDITVTAGSVQNPDETLIWQLENTADGYVTLYNAANDCYLAGNGTKNKGTLISSVTNFAKFTPSGTSTYEFVNLGNRNSGINCNLRRNGTYGFAMYSTQTGGALTLYKEVAGAVYYATSTGRCTHTWGDWMEVDDIQHTRVCDNCGETETTSHIWGAGSLNQEQTLVSYPCQDCDHVKQADYSSILLGDFNSDLAITNEDVIYLLWHTMFAETYPIDHMVDYNKDGLTTNEDVIYLLWYTMFPESYPLS